MLVRTAAALCLAASVAIAQPEGARNAALDYWRAGTLASNFAKTAGASAAPDWDAIGANLDPAKMPPEFAAARKEIAPEAITHFLRAAATPHCDFQHHLEDGWMMLLPELAVVRSLARQARVDARSKLMEGDGAGAAERITAMYRSAGHIARGNVLISTLVCAAIAHAADDEVRVLAGSGKLAEADRARLLEAINALKGDGMHFRAALEGERRVTSGWLKREFTGAGASARFVKEFVEMSKETTEAERLRAAAVAKLTPEQFAGAGAKLDEYYAALLKAWDGPDAKAALAGLEQRMAKEEFGPVAAILAPAMSKVRSAHDKAMGNLAAAEAALRKP